MVPLQFAPILQHRPWGGARLAEAFGRSLPPGRPIGESWELVSLPECESVCVSAPYEGRTLREIIDAEGSAVLGRAAIVDGRFPLLIKLLDARENLSVQVHPKPPPGRTLAPGVKHEAWVVLDAAPGARMFIGLRAGVTRDEVARAVERGVLPELLQERPAHRGDAFHLPSGVIHALGAGILVAEIQTPSDVTYRLYDWGRRDESGRPRSLHVDAALANLRDDVRESEIRQELRPGELPDAVRLCRSETFFIDQLVCPDPVSLDLPSDRFRVWMIVSGAGEMFGEQGGVPLRSGQTLLLPAGMRCMRIQPSATLAILDVTPRLDIREGSA